MITYHINENKNGYKIFVLGVIEELLKKSTDIFSYDVWPKNNKDLPKVSRG